MEQIIMSHENNREAKGYNAEEILVPLCGMAIVAFSEMNDID